MKTWLLAASLSTVLLVPLAAADPQCYWHPAAREFVWEFSSHTVYLEDGDPVCTASLHTPVSACALVPRESIWQATFHVVYVAEDCTTTVSPDPECPAGGEWPRCI